jgi:uncharacterized protein YndB with AHSA1/START domain
MSDPIEPTNTVLVERVFAHPPEKLWRALTDPSLLAQWLLKNDFSPSVGQRFQFRADPVQNWDGVIHCEVLAIEPQRSLSYTWSSMGLQSVILFTLTPEEGGTRLRMEQSGFRPDQEAAFRGAQYGWQKFMGQLEQLLAGGLS